MSESNKIQIIIPNNNIAERKYIIDVLLGEYLGVKYILKISDNEIDYRIKLNDNNVIIIKDSFFSNFPENQEYLNQKNIPDSVSYFSDKNYSTEKNIPIIYGKNIITNNNNIINCQIDIFASSFFMLTRWEENVIKTKDKFNRFPDNISLAQKNKFHHTPIVNQYTELLWNMLLKSRYNHTRKNRIYEIKITHDVDFFNRYDSPKKFYKALAGDILKRKSPTLFVKTLTEYLPIKSGKKNDPYNTFDFFMDISEKYNLKSNFYFIPELIGESDAQYNINGKYIIEMIKHIKTRGHNIGIHAGLKTYNNTNIYTTELNRLKNIIPNITEGRQHFLMFENPKTFQILNSNNILTDSTLGYSNDIGFRCGTCYPFPVFDILEQKKLTLIEEPLIFMETALKKTTQNTDEFFNKAIEISNTVKKYSGKFIILWHQSNTNINEWKNYIPIYEKIISN